MSKWRLSSLQPLIWTFLGLVAVGALLALNETAREVAKDTARTIFGIFTTPFIFEGTIAIVGFLMVLGINHWRLQKEGDGWVYLVTQEPDPGSAKLPAAITQRLQGVVMQQQPEAVDEAGTARARIEGFLELGMSAQATEVMADCDELPDDEVTLALRVRVLAANLDTDTARSMLLHAAATRFPGKRALFAQTALDCADWLDTHTPQQKEAAQRWRSEVRALVG